eukprot:4526810-Amphidinium_carterae.1
MQSSEKDAKRGTLGNTKFEAWGEDGDTTSLSTDCLPADPSNPDNDEFSWASLEQMAGFQGSDARGFDSEVENGTCTCKRRSTLTRLTNNVASYAASHPKWISRAK